MAAKFCPHTGKYTYATRTHAGGALAALRARRAGADLHVYHCPTCRAYHLGRLADRRPGKEAGR